MSPAGRAGGFGKNVVIALALVAAGFFGAWLRFRPHLGTTGVYTDGVQQYDGGAGEPIRYAVWEQPTPLAGEVNTIEAEHSPSLSADGRWLVFAVGERGADSELWIAELEGGVARDARPLYELNSSFDELAPAFGQGALWFASNRPGGAGGFDLWRADFAQGEFSEPRPLDDSLNTPRDELDPAPLPGGGALAFASNRDTHGRSGCDLYLARPAEGGAWDVSALHELNSTHDDREPCFTRDGRRVVFASDRDGERGAYDLYGSLRERGAWLPPAPLAGLDSELVERGPTLSADGFTLWLERSRVGEAPDLYRARSLELFQRPGPRVGWLDLVILVALLLLALLAFLAKRWETIEVLYKCFLVSVVAHLLLLWWFGTIHPEGEVTPLAPGSPTFQVQLASAPRRADSASAERGGRLAARRDEAATALAAPAREAARLEAFADEARSAARERLAHDRAEPTRLPARERAAAEPARETSTPAARLADASPAAALLREPSRALEVAAGETRSTTQHEPTEVGAPRRAARGEFRPQEPGAAASEVARQERTTAEALPAARRTSSPRGAAPAGLATLTPTAQPHESFERTRGAPAELELVARASDARRASEQRAARRSAPPAGGATSSEPVLPAARSNLAPTRAALAGSEPKGPERATLDLAPVAVVGLPTSELRAPAVVQPPAPSSPARASGSAELKLAVPSPDARPARRTNPSASAAPRRLAALHGERAAQPAAYAPAADAPREAEPPVAFERALHTPYAARFGPAKARALEEFGGDSQSEAAVAAGLRYLANTQRREGFWGDPEQRDEKYGYVLVGKTGLALLAFLGAGHTHLSGSEHSPVVQRGVDFLLAIQGDASGHFGDTSAYGHGIATYALAETFAITGDERLREPLRRAVAQIVRHQNRHERAGRRDLRRFGGWSYYFSGPRTIDSWPRVSITAWQVMALRSAQLGGLDIPRQVLADARSFLEGALDEQRGCFRYSHDPSRLRGPYAILPGSTPAALFALHLLGEDLGQPRFEEPLRFVLERAPDGYRYTGDDAFVARARGNLYFWYYGSLAMMKRGGGAWQRWNGAMKETLVEAQRDDGSWEPISVYSRYADDTQHDAVYSTAMCVLSLEVYYRYFTPLLDAGPAAR